MQRKTTIVLVLCSGLYLMFEGMSYLSLWYVEERYNFSYAPIMESLSEQQNAALKQFVNRDKSEPTEQDPILGWVARRETNTAGMRDDREYEKVPPPDTLRISAFGDSFTFSSDVALEDSWSKQLSAIEPSVEVLNYGVGAYVLDQAFLRYLKVGTTYNPDIVFIGYMSENIARNVNIFRPFYTGDGGGFIFTKPRYQVKDGELTLLDNPISTLEEHERFLQNGTETLREIGKSDYFYQNGYRRWLVDILPSVRFLNVFISLIKMKVLYPIFTTDKKYYTNSEAYRVTSKIFAEFHDKVLNSGALPIIVVYPDRPDQKRNRAKKARRYAPLLNEFRAKGYRYIDLMDALEPIESRHTVEELTVAWGHFSPLGNRILAEHMLGRLRDWDLLCRGEVADAKCRDRAGQAVAPIN